MKSASLWGLLLLSLVLNGCGPSFGRYLVPGRLESSDQRMAYLQENKAAYGSQQEWQKALNYTTWSYSSKWWECYSALDCAMKARDYAIAGYLLDQGADPNIKPPMKFIDVTDLEYPIQRAVIKSRSDDEAAKWSRLLLQYGANPNLSSRSYMPALQQAIKSHYPETVRLLLENGASTKTVTAVDAPEVADHVRIKSKPLPRWYNALNTAVRYARDGNEIDQQIVKTLLEYGADPFDMSGSNFPSLPGFARQQGKPKLAEYSIAAYAEVYRLNIAQQAEFRQRLAAYDQQLVARQDAAEEKRRQVARQEASQMVDESNAWVGTATRLIQGTSNQYQLAEQQRQASPTSTASKTSTTTAPQKRVDNSCDNSPYCKAVSYGGPFIFAQELTVTTTGYNNATACERGWLARPANLCAKQEDGKWVYYSEMGYSFEACECNELEFKSQCTTRSTWYCGNPNPAKGSEGKVMVE